VIEKTGEWNGSERMRAKSYCAIQQQDIRLLQCPHCSWLSLIDDCAEHGYGEMTARLESAHSCAKHFQSDGNMELADLRQWIYNNDIDLTTISPKNLELLVGSVFADKFKCTAHHIGGTGDGGIDLVLLASDTPIIVQVKRYERAQKKVPAVVVRELIGSMVIEGANCGIIVTSGNGATSNCEDTIRSAKARGFAVSVYSQSMLKEVLQLETTNLKDEFLRMFKERCRHPMTL
jgi:hypothetical protein